MIVSISVNVTNIIASLLLVFVFDAGFVGIAVGTLIAQWVGALLAFALAVRLARRHGLPQFRVSRDSFVALLPAVDFPRKINRFQLGDSFFIEFALCTFHALYRRPGT